MLERGMMCLVRWALALVSPVAVVCFPCFPGCFPESRPWALSLEAVVVRHCLSVISFSLSLYTWYKLLWFTRFTGLTSCMQRGPWWPSAVCSACFGSPASNCVSRTAILCRRLWQFMQQIDSTRGIFFLVCLNVGSCVVVSLECKLLALGSKESYFSSSPKKQDNDPKHTSKSNSEWLKKTQLRFWSGTLQFGWIKTILQRRVGQNSSTAMWKTHRQLLQTLVCSCCCKGCRGLLPDPNPRVPKYFRVSGRVSG